MTEAAAPSVNRVSARSRHRPLPDRGRRVAPSPNKRRSGGCTSRHTSRAVVVRFISVVGAEIGISPVDRRFVDLGDDDLLVHEPAVGDHPLQDPLRSEERLRQLVQIVLADATGVLDASDQL